MHLIFQNYKLACFSLLTQFLKLRYNSHCLKFTPLKWSNSVVFTVFTKLCNYHYLVPEHFHQPPTNPVTIRSHSSFHFLSLWNYLFCTIQINGLFPYVVFCFWLLSPSVMFIRFIHIVAGVSTSFPLMAE